MDAANSSSRIARYDTPRRWLYQRDVFGGLGSLRELGVSGAMAAGKLAIVRFGGCFIE